MLVVCAALLESSVIPRQSRIAYSCSCTTALSRKCWSPVCIVAYHNGWGAVQYMCIVAHHSSVSQYMCVPALLKAVYQVTLHVCVPALLTALYQVALCVSALLAII